MVNDRPPRLFHHIRALAPEESADLVQKIGMLTHKPSYVVLFDRIYYILSGAWAACAPRCNPEYTFKLPEKTAPFTMDIRPVCISRPGFAVLEEGRDYVVDKSVCYLDPSIDLPVAHIQISGVVMTWEERFKERWL